SIFVFFNATAPTVLYPLSLHDALPIFVEPPCTLHYEVVASWLAMRDAASADGIDLQARSSFRDFATQVAIWNSKWRGERPLYDREGRDRKSTRLNSSHVKSSYAVFCLKRKRNSDR